jgi:hypothetical protein
MCITQSISAGAEGCVAPSEALTKIRKSVGYDALARSSSDVLIEGKSHYLGMAGSYQLHLSPKGECLLTIDAHGRHQDGYNGTTVWERLFSGRSHELDFGEAESQEAFLAVRTHRWLSEGSPYQLIPDAGPLMPGEQAFQLVRKNDLLPTEIVVDTKTWLPMRASRRWVFGALTWEFSDYVGYHGVKWPNRSRFSRGDKADLFEVRQVTSVSKQQAEYFGAPLEQSRAVWEIGTTPRVQLMRTASGHLFVKPRINGQDVGWFAFDTGTGFGMCISQKAADQLHLPAFGKVMAGGAGKQSEVQFRETGSFQLGATSMKPMIMMELPKAFTDSMASLFGFEWGGTVGRDFISEVTVEFDLTNATLDLHDPATYELANGAWLPLRLNHGIPCLKCKIEAQDEGWFQFDTGAGAVAIVHSPTVEKFDLLKGRTTQAQPLQGVGGAIDAERGTMERFSVGERALKNVTTFFVTGKQGALADPYVMGTFGAGVLGGVKVIFDYGRKRMGMASQ